MQGVAAGAGGALLAGLAVSSLVGPELLPLPSSREAFAWAYRNLGLSMPVFAVVLLLFVLSVRQLRHRLARGEALEQVAQADHLADIWTSVFFGIGVIWTAIGMRNALLFALGDPQATLQQGAFAVLQRLVDGGILLALSTTIFGGVGGYLMRVVKTLSVGADLKRYYRDQASAQGREMLLSLQAMEHHLRQLCSGQGERRDRAG
jgi:hypothetical protein